MNVKYKIKDTEPVDDLPQLHGNHSILPPVLHIGTIQGNLLEVEMTPDTEAANYIIDHDVDFWRFVFRFLLSRFWPSVRSLYFWHEGRHGGGCRMLGWVGVRGDRLVEGTGRGHVDRHVGHVKGGGGALEHPWKSYPRHWL